MVYKIYADCKENGVSSCQWQEGTTDKRTSVEKPKRVDLKPDLVATVQQLIEEDDHITTSAVAEAVNISQPTASRIISKDLGLGKVSACFVPKLLTLTHKAIISMDCARSLLRRTGPNTIANHCIGDEMYVHFSTPRGKCQSMAWEQIQLYRIKKTFACFLGKVRAETL